MKIHPNKQKLVLNLSQYLDTDISLDVILTYVLDSIRLFRHIHPELSEHDYISVRSIKERNNTNIEISPKQLADRIIII